MLILSGIVISSLFSALVSLVKYSADPQDVLPAITFWLMGSLSSVTRETLYTGAPFLLVGIAAIFLFRWKLNALTLPQEEAEALGIPVTRIRAIVIIGAAMITASAVSMCGDVYKRQVQWRRNMRHWQIKSLQPFPKAEQQEGRSCD